MSNKYIHHINDGGMLVPTSSVSIINLDGTNEVTPTRVSGIETQINNAMTQLANIATDACALGAVGDGITDNTNSIQMALNKKGHVIISKAGTYIAKSLKIDSNTYFELYQGVTLKLKSGTSDFIITNLDKTNGNTNIIIDGGTWDIDYINNPSVGSAPLYDGHGFMFQNITNSSFKNITIKNASKYAILIANCDTVTGENITFDTHSDGIHFQPPANNIRLNGIYGTTGDDMIAFTLGDYISHAYTSTGNFTNISIQNVYCNNVKSVLKFTGSGTGNQYYFDNISVKNLFGTTRRTWLSIIDDVIDSNPYLLNTVIKRLSIDNVDVKQTEPSMAVLLQTAKCNLSISNLKVTQPNANYSYIQIEKHVDDLVLSNVNFDSIVTDTIFLKLTSTATVGAITVSKLLFKNMPTNNKIFSIDGTVDTLNINNAMIDGGTINNQIFLDSASTAVFTNGINTNGLDIKNVNQVFTIRTNALIRCSNTNAINCNAFTIANGATAIVRLISYDDLQFDPSNQNGGKTSYNAPNWKIWNITNLNNAQAWDKVTCINSTYIKGLKIYDGTAWKTATIT